MTLIPSEFNYTFFLFSSHLINISWILDMPKQGERKTLFFIGMIQKNGCLTAKRKKGHMKGNCLKDTTITFVLPHKGRPQTTRNQEPVVVADPAAVLGLGLNKDKKLSIRT